VFGWLLINLPFVEYSITISTSRNTIENSIEIQRETNAFSCILNIIDTIIIAPRIQYNFIELFISSPP